MQETVELAPHPGQATRRLLRRRLSADPAGVTGALLFGCLSFTPSLLPRDWVLQGVVSGISAAFGYGVGVFVAWLAHAVSGRVLSPGARRGLWVVIACLGAPLVAYSLWRGQRWQRDVHRLTDEVLPDPYEWVRILLLGALVLLAVVAVSRALRWLVRLVAGALMRLVPPRLARALAVLVVLALLGTMNNGLLWRGLVTAANSAAGAINDWTDAGTVRPLAGERSGSPASLVSWTSLGRQGRDFVALGPSVAELTAFSGAPARIPVRVYAGLRSAPTTSERAALAVRELRRAGGFGRAVLVVATTTGTGLVDPSAAAAIEYMYGGDTAIVAVQYSYLPSWFSFLVDQERAEEAGRQLFNQVYDVWAALPAAHRPRLLVTGSSLGAFGGEAAFGGLADIRNRTDGVVWAGPPNASGLHRMLVERRDRRTPEWLPVYESGRTVRFAAAPGDLAQPATPWTHPRVVYLQNGSDPIVYWSPRLAFAKPDWLSEPRARDVSPDMVWIPVVTFWQVTADLPFAFGAPPGHGHRYREVFADAWAAVAPPAGWTDRDTVRLRARLAAEAG